MTFWKVTIHPHKYAKSQSLHELIAFKHPAKLAKSRFGFLCPLGVKYDHICNYIDTCSKRIKHWPMILVALGLRIKLFSRAI
jgi:hypothetical protein